MDGLKKCKQCQSEINKKAKVCPNCRKKQGGKGKFIVIGIIVFFILVGALGGNKDGSTPAGSDDMQTANASKGKATTAPTAIPTEKPKEEIIEVTAEELLTAYKENEVKADKLYKGKTVEITGTVKSIGKDILDSVYITFSGEEFSLTSIQCYFKDSDEIDKVAELKEGDTITIQGKCDGGTLNILIKKCVIK